MLRKAARETSKNANNAAPAEKTIKSGIKKRNSTQPPKKHALKVQEHKDEKADNGEAQKTDHPVEIKEKLGKMVPQKQQIYEGKRKAKVVDEIDCEFIIF